jgi:hypothetical protein
LRASATASTPPAGGDHAHARALEQRRQNPPVHRAVVGHQRCHVLAVGQPRVERRRRQVGLGAALRRDVHRHERQVEVETAAETRLALDAQLAAHLGDEMLADGQPEPGTASGGSRSRLRERVEDDRDLRLLDADARVAHLEEQPVLPCLRDREVHFALRREFDRVVEEVQQDLAQVTAVEHHAPRRVRRDRHAEQQPLAPRRFGHQVLEIDRHLRQVGARRLDVQSAPPRCATGRARR